MSDSRRCYVAESEDGIRANAIFSSREEADIYAGSSGLVTEYPIWDVQPPELECFPFAEHQEGPWSELYEIAPGQWNKKRSCARCLRLTIRLVTGAAFTPQGEP